MQPPKPGLYEHYSGRRYRVIGVARHSETLDELVIYQALYDDPQFGSQANWVRPLGLFTEKVEHNGRLGPRFRRIEN